MKNKAMHMGMIIASKIIRIGLIFFVQIVERMIYRYFKFEPFYGKRLSKR